MFIMAGSLILALAAFFHSKGNMASGAFTTAVNADGMRVYGNFTTTAGCQIFLVTNNSQVFQTLYTIVYRVKTAYLSYR